MPLQRSGSGMRAGGGSENALHAISFVDNFQHPATVNFYT
jgi:hypothetical protein